MKKRTFFTTLLLFLIFMNTIYCFILTIMFKDSMENSKERSLSEHYAIAAMMQNDMQALSERQVFTQENLLSSLRQYTDMFRNKNSGFALYDGTHILFQNKESDLFLDESIIHDLDSLEENVRFTGYSKDETQKFYIKGRLGKPFSQYILLYYIDVSETIKEWKNIRLLLFGGGSVLSMVLAGFLLMLLERIFRPLLEISEITQEIACGQYDKRLPAAGKIVGKKLSASDYKSAKAHKRYKDELSDMALCFNNMADKIQSQIRELDLAGRQKQEFIDNFAHELKTPLTAIYGYAEYLQKAAASENDRQEAAEYIMSECRRVQNMAHQLMDLVVLRESEFSVEAVSIELLFEEIQTIMLPISIKKGVTLNYISDLSSLKGDAGLLKHLLTNLIANAIQSCDKGGLVKAAAYSGKHGDCIEITDNGRGMKSNELDHIKEAFYRVDKSRSREDGGAGLGLAICSKIVEILDIRMEFQSLEDHGTSVFLYFETISDSGLIQ